MTFTQKIIGNVKYLIQKEIRLSEDADYFGSNEALENEARILRQLELLGYDFENDDSAAEYFNKATTKEKWEYHLNVILPKIEFIYP